MKGEIVDDFDTIKAVGQALARRRRQAAHWYGCDESEIVEAQMRVPTRQELEERVADYLQKDPYFRLEDGAAKEAAADLVRIFNQWTVEVIAPEVLDQIDN